MPARISVPRFSDGVNPFNPITGVAWDHSYWVEGPEFVALGYANNATITTWPDETGTSDLTSEGSPTYVTSRVALGSQPAVVTVASATSRVKLGASWTTINQPFTVVMVVEGIGDGALGVSVHHNDQAWAAHNLGSAWKANAGTTISGGTSDTLKHLHVFVANGASSKIIVDGTTLVTADAASQLCTSLCFFGLVSTSAYNMIGSSPFAAVAPAVLSSTDLDNLLSWSRSKYGTP